MPDDILQQVAQQAPSVGSGGVVGMVLSIFAGMKMFATSKDIDLAKSELRAELAEKYAHKDDLAKMGEDLSYIRQRIDQIVDRK